ncbi:MAG: cytochrome ubiquinol oxidase subunit I [Thermoleophilia bacterium]|nr:cytochrome ubiquinol oxidase subunit I [Thermoleophilia bacterium]
MDVLELSRLQFALTSMFHFIFVPLTLGLSILVAFMETKYVRTGNEMYLRMTKFWGKLFLINFALGVVTGITLEFQFGMNWSKYSEYVGDIFGAPLAIEATAAFFLESTFIGLWIFGWNRISPRLHAVSIWVVAFATNLSGLWILLANGWMQHPVGYVLRNGRAEMVDFMAMVTNPYGLLKFGHQIMAGYVVAAFFVMGISAWHLRRQNSTELFKSSFKIAAVFALVSSLGVGLIGDFHAKGVAESQPAKFAAMESIWNTQDDADWNLIVIPDTSGHKNSVEAVGLPEVLSYLATGDFDGRVTGLNDIPANERPPVLPVFTSFRLMVYLGMLFALLAVIATFKAWRGTLLTSRRFLWIMVYMIPLPYIANQLGWIVAEVGRQPWIVYGVLLTADAGSPAVSLSQVWTSLTAFTLVYAMLGAIDIFLLFKVARKGPDDDLTFIVKPANSQGA